MQNIRKKDDQAKKTTFSRFRLENWCHLMNLIQNVIYCDWKGQIIVLETVRLFPLFVGSRICECEWWIESDKNGRIE